MTPAGRIAACARMLLAAALAGACGCVSYLHPVPPPPQHLKEPCQNTPQCSRDHVYVFMVHGMDPLNYANLSGLRDYIQALGFHKTYYGQLYHTPHFDKEIHKIHRADPDAHFVLIGFSFGANCVRALAQSANKESVPIDLLVYLGGNTLKDIPRDKPANAVRIVNILASGCIWNGCWMEGALNMHETNVWHFGSPTHPRTLEVLAQELAVVAAAVPVVVPPDKSMPPADEIAPAPRPVTALKTSPRGDWDFLRPVTHLNMPASPAEPARATTPAAAPVEKTVAR